MKHRNKLKDSLSLLYEVSSLVVSNKYLEEILVMLVNLTAKIMDSKICSLMLLDDQKKNLVIKATQSLSPAYQNKPPIKVQGSVIGRVVLRKKPQIIHNVQKEEGYQYPQVAKAEGLISLISVPLIVKGDVIGVLNCYTSTARDFTLEEIKILNGVANQAALAIANTKLLAEKIEAVEALEARKKIEKAKGLLMKRTNLNEEDAYRLLQKRSMDQRRSLKEVAEAILLTEKI